MTQPKTRRSVLYVPATNTKAMAKVASLDCDAVIFDLEDSVAPDAKAEGRLQLIEFFRTNRPASSQEWVIRVNATSQGPSPEDVDVVAACEPHAMLVPKLEHIDMLAAARGMLSKRTSAKIRLWAMIETPRGIVDLRTLAAFGTGGAIGLECFVAGTNDIAKDVGLPLPEVRRTMEHWLASLVLHGRAFGIDVVDGVYNDFRDEAGFGAECRAGALLGFDGKTLIHPAQIAAANAAFSPSEAAIADARTVVTVFAQPENAGKGVISINGKMVELLHLHIARKVLAKARVSA